MTKDVTLREMIEAMSAYADDETFRWYALDSNTTLRITVGQLRKELNELTHFRLQAAFNATSEELGRAAVEQSAKERLREATERLKQINDGNEP
jgi:hypothetical protein